MTGIAASRFSRRMLIAATLAAAAGGVTSVAAQERAAEIVATMTLRQQAARMFILPVSGPELTGDESAWLGELQPGGVILVERNFDASHDVHSLTSAIHGTAPSLPPLVSLDQEGGTVTRLWDDPAPDAPTMGTLSLDEITSFARQRAALLASYGVDLNFAPVADVAFTPDSFMAGRTFGADPEWVAECVVAYLDGVKDTPVVHCVKHFPGHGRVSVDSHQDLPLLEVDPTTWASADALPFAAAIAAGVPMVMLGHLAVPMWDDLPASLSPAAVKVLREDLGFPGVIVTDDLYMGALNAWQPLEIVDMAISAGVDLLLYVDLPDAPQALVNHVVGLVRQGAIGEERIRESARRIVAMQLAASP